MLYFEVSLYEQDECQSVNRMPDVFKVEWVKVYM